MSASKVPDALSNRIPLGLLSSRKCYDQSPFTRPGARAYPTNRQMPFQPRTVFEPSEDLAKTNFLRHQASALRELRQTVSSVDLIIECRDARLPLTTWNLDLEDAARGRARLVCLTKADMTSACDLAEYSAYRRIVADSVRRPLAGVIDVGYVIHHHRDGCSTRTLLSHMQVLAEARDAVRPMQAIIVGMPNVGKSTILNQLRSLSHKLSGLDRTSKVAKAAATANTAGTTKRIGQSVRIDFGIDRFMYIKDTPGVFVPYVPDPLTMLKMGLVSGLQDGVIPLQILADFLLFRLNIYGSKCYRRFCHATNDVDVFLDTIASRTGKLKPGSVPDRDQSAKFVLELYRRGGFGRFVLDDVTEDTLEAKRRQRYDMPISMSQVRRQEKAARKLKVPTGGDFNPLDTAA